MSTTTTCHKCHSNLIIIRCDGCFFKRCINCLKKCDNCGMHLCGYCSDVYSYCPVPWRFDGEHDTQEHQAEEHVFNKTIQ